MQFVEFLCTTLSPEEINRKIPNIHQLCKDLLLQPEDAFLIARSFIDYSEISAKHSLETTAENLPNLELSETAEDGEIGETQAEEKYSKNSIKDDTLVKVIATIVPTEKLSPAFYSAFWSNSLGDIHLPQLQYDTAIENLSRELNAAMDPKDVCHHLIIKNI